MKLANVVRSRTKMLKKKLLTDRSGNLQEQILNDAAKRMSDEIDFEILCGMLCEMGWTKVVLSPMTRETSDAIDAWLVENVSNPFETMGLVWIFEDEQDANWFSLRWLG
jgi:hypothetical protein